MQNKLSSQALKDGRQQRYNSTSISFYTLLLLYLFAYIIIQNFKNTQVILWVFYVLVPFLDRVIPVDENNPSLEEQSDLSGNLFYKLPLYLAVFADRMFVYFIVSYLCNNELNLIQLFCLIPILGTLGASNINVAHELFHKDNLIDKWVGRLALSRNFYMHFTIEHIYGHHRNVATPVDPATAKQGQTIYHFWIQSIIGTYRSSWGIEVERLKKLYEITTPFSIYNQLIWANFVYLLEAGLFYYLNGSIGIFWFTVMGIISVIYLESINYIEHYGLERQQLVNGQYEPVDIRHSWNAPHRLSNYLLFKVQRHSDHHENPSKPYQTLCSYNVSPRMPHGYPVCIVMAHFPSLWFDVMDNHIQDYKNNKPESIITKQKVEGFIRKVAIVITVILIFSGIDG